MVLGCFVSATPMVHYGSDHESEFASEVHVLAPLFTGEPLVRVDFTQTRPDSTDSQVNQCLDVSLNTLDIVGETISLAHR